MTFTTLSNNDGNADSTERNPHLHSRAGTILSVGTHTLHVDFTTSSHAIAGNIYLFVESPGVISVGRAGAAADATSAAANVFVETTI